MQDRAISFETRKATIEDATAVAAILRESFEEFRGRLEPPSGALDETQRSVEDSMTRAVCFVAEANGEIVGCVFADRKSREEMYLFRLAVMPEFRRFGIGKALIGLVEKLAFDVGTDQVRLMTRLVMTDNIAFYKKLGYEHVRDGGHEETGVPYYAVLIKRLR